MKRKRSDDQVNVNYGVDRLSSLPHDILGHILSFLDTKSAMRTSVLSTQFRDAWASSPSLYFKLSRVRIGSSHSSVLQAGLNDMSRSFETNVNSVLQRRKDCMSLVSFRLSLHVSVTSRFIEECIHYAVQRNIEHLRIRGNTTIDQGPATLPRLLVTSSFLITLHLNNARGDSIELPKSVSLPNLKIMRLKNFEFSSKNYNGEVFSGCPNLEDLVLVNCSIRPRDELKILDVNCLKLKRLEIGDWRSPWECFDEHMISVNAPNLVFFELRAFITRVDFTTDLRCLDRACIELSVPISERLMTTSETLFSMLHHIHRVEVLQISLGTMMVINAFPELRDEKMPQLENLKIVKCKGDIAMQELKDALEEIGQDAMTFGFCEDPQPSSSGHTILVESSLSQESSSLSQKSSSFTDQMVE